MLHFLIVLLFSTGIIDGQTNSSEKYTTTESSITLSLNPIQNEIQPSTSNPLLAKTSSTSATLSATTTETPTLTSTSSSASTSISSSTATPIPTSTSTETPTSTSTPTSTPIPTSTSTETQTSTSTPTSTPIPTSTTTPYQISTSTEILTTTSPKEIIAIRAVNHSMDWIERQLSLSWTIENKHLKELRFYIIRIEKPAGSCSISTFKTNYSNTQDINEIIKNDTRYMLKKCSEKTDPADIIKDNSNITIKNQIHFSVDIYGVNAIGIQKLTDPSINVTLQKPSTEVHITWIERGPKYIKLKWSPSVLNDSRNPITGYNIKVLNWIIISENVSSNEWQVDNLSECSNYCFTIKAYNDAGISDNNFTTCYNTRISQFGNIILNNISSELSETRNISWNYSGRKKCVSEYELEYWTDTKDKKTINETESFYNVNGLNLNKMYNARVRAKTEFEKDGDGKFGNYSDIKTFFTGKEKITLHSINHSMNWFTRTLWISWNVTDTNSSGILSYIIQIRDNVTKCAIYVFRANDSGKTDTFLTNDTAYNLTQCFRMKEDNVFVQNVYNKSFTINTTIITFTVDIYGVNAIGIQKLTDPSINVTLKKPSTEVHITAIERGPNYIKLKWSPSVLNDSRNPITGYNIKVLNGIIISKNVSSNEWKTNNLSECSKYCFTIKVYNDAGISDNNFTTCYNTTISKLHHIILNNVSSELSETRNISWSYPGKEICIHGYTFKYKKGDSDWISQNIPTKFYELKGLDTYQLYSIQVIPLTYYQMSGDQSPVHNPVSSTFSNGRKNYLLSVFLALFIILSIALLILIVFKFHKEKLIIAFNHASTVCKGRESSNNGNDSQKKNRIPMTNVKHKSEEIICPEFLDCHTLPNFLSKIYGTGKSLEEFAKYFTYMHENNDGRLIEEYKKLGDVSGMMEKQLHLTKFVGKSPFNLKKNRFLNILPFDQNRVILQNKPTSENYLNANFVCYTNDATKAEYIASQGPIESTISDFILMIWEQNVSCIVMLTRPTEDGKFKCLQYWPDVLGTKCNFGHKKEFFISKISEKEETSHFERKLLFQNTITNEERSIYQLYMHMWMDFSAPDLKHFYNVLCRFQELVDTSVNSPFLVHCSAGVGRTGTFICLDRIIRKILQGNRNVDVYKTVLELRASRNLMVQRQAQYIFIHEFLDFFITKYLTEGGNSMNGTIN